MNLAARRSVSGVESIRTSSRICDVGSHPPVLKNARFAANSFPMITDRRMPPKLLSTLVANSATAS